MASIPGVQSVCVADATPLSGSYDHSFVQLRQPGSENGPADVLIGVHRASPGYLRTLQVPLLAGRWFTEQDVHGAKRIVVINETMARRYWPGADPVGQSLDLSMAIEPGYAPVEIVGVVGDVKYDDMAATFGNDVYVPYLQSGYPVYYLTVRTAGDPLSLVTAVRQTVTAVNREVPISDVMTMAQRMANSTSRTRFIAVLLALFAASGIGARRHGSVRIDRLLGRAADSRDRDSDGPWGPVVSGALPDVVSGHAAGRPGWRDRSGGCPHSDPAHARPPV